MGFLSLQGLAPRGPGEHLAVHRLPHPLQEVRGAAPHREARGPATIYVQTRQRGRGWPRREA